MNKPAVPVIFLLARANNGNSANRVCLVTGAYCFGTEPRTEPLTRGRDADNDTGLHAPAIGAKRSGWAWAEISRSVGRTTCTASIQTGPMARCDRLGQGGGERGPDALPPALRPRRGVSIHRPARSHWLKPTRHLARDN
jgi:hypothetical protein